MRLWFEALICVVLLGVPLSLDCGCVARETAVRAVPPEQVAACRYLGEVRGWSGLPDVEAAEADAFEQADDLGATAVVWESSGIGGGWTASAAGRAYRCPKVRGAALPE
jgi:hypothetical protein